MVAWVKALLFVIGGVTAAAGTAYMTGLLDPWLGRGPAVVASAPQTPAEAPAAASQPAPAQDESPAGDEAAAPPAAEGEVPLPGDPSTTDKQARLTPPTFDLLRVEPDGSVVIAGKGAAGAQIEILEGDKVIAKAEANADGDFVAVLDEPLKPGDYQLALRATSPDSDTAVSTETAIVSVPETTDGQVLAMVEQPGAPAQLITVPEATGDAAGAAGAGASAASPQPAQGGQGETPPAATAGASTGQDAASAETGTGPDASTSGEAQVAAAPPAGDNVTSSEQQPATGSVVVVEAVEIEGGTIFVAGVAEPGRTVRVYADEIFLGDARASEGGRFLVEAQRDLAVGNYVIRADLLDADGTVISRAAVPFEREPGESIAAVAAPAQPQPAANGVTDGSAAQSAGDTQQDVAAGAPPAASSDTQAAPTASEDIASAPDAQQPAPANQPAAPAAAGDEAQSETDTEIAAAPEAGGNDDGLTAPKLQRVDGAVIIRRGDSLWRISRRVYGMGVRYSTIYLANQDQIRNPDRIWPGQVFSVPRETAEGEEADMEAIGEQSVLPGTGAAAVNQ
ncbi:LysM peptidoglycan-binding domain-containing protein [Mesorhizobium sp. CAU 1732]|uniref:LysM peptidoglycan-binding domain-containing protein n=1 Tax=Mesorhizobium sp. CAU 1732 TaxID=3140358 RepID=UPI0032602A04